MVTATASPELQNPEACVMEDQTGLRSDQVKELFILIHGTWARGAEWTDMQPAPAGTPAQGDGALLQRFPVLRRFPVLHRILPIQGLLATEAGEAGSADKQWTLAKWFAEREGASLQRFLWSGRNSHEARLQAGRALQSELRRLLTPLEPEIPVYIVAHSHAGNVALYALRDEWLRRRVTRVACLATPFLHLSRDRLKSSWLMLCAIAMGISLLIVVGVFLLESLLDLAEVSGSYWRTAIVLALALLGVLWFLRRRLAAAGLSWSPAEYLRARRVKGVELDAKLESLELPELSLEQLIAVRAASDEAAGALVTAQFLSWAAWTVWYGLDRFTGKWLKRFFLAVVAVATVAEFIPGRSSTESGSGFNFDDAASLVIGIAVFAIGCVGVVIVAGIAGSALAFGYDACAWFRSVRTSAEDSPPGKTVVQQVQLAGFRHGAIHDEEDIIAVLDDFLRPTVAPRRLTVWSEVNLPKEVSEALEELEAFCRDSAGDSPFAEEHASWWRARRVGALFLGPPGTGKSLAAQILAKRLDRELLRVDLAALVGKYVGETEKNLQRVFDEAASSGSILFFDEADALFGKRADVDSAHDRYANLETSFLLARIEEFEGLVLIAANTHESIDPAFLRRLPYAIEFRLPRGVTPQG